jgi:hypothetical protein
VAGAEEGVQGEGTVVAVVDAAVVDAAMVDAQW